MTRHKAYTKIPFAALFFAATLISPVLHALNIPDYRFHTMPETSYYGGIHSIAKDSVGRMWFSGYDALFMYNGTSFVRMTDLVTNLLPNSYWSYGQVITDNRKGLYVGTNQGLLRFNYRKLEFEFVLEGNIGSVTANNDGTVWLIRNNGIESFSPERLPAVTRYPMPPEMSAPGRTLTLVCTKEYVYAASGGDLYRLNRETGQYVLFASVGGGSCVIRDVVECNGSVYVLTLMDGLYECDGNGRIGRYFRLPLEYEKSAGAKELHLDSQDAIGTAAAGAAYRQHAAAAFRPPLSLLPAQQFGMVDLPRSRRRDMGRHIRRQTGLHDLRGQRRGLFQSHAGRAEPSHRQLFRRGFGRQSLDRNGGGGELTAGTAATDGSSITRRRAAAA